jgi:hypothetical protein
MNYKIGNWIDIEDEDVPKDGTTFLAVLGNMGWFSEGTPGIIIVSMKYTDSSYYVADISGEVEIDEVSASYVFAEVKIIKWAKIIRSES